MPFVNVQISKIPKKPTKIIVLKWVSCNVNTLVTVSYITIDKNKNYMAKCILGEHLSK